MAILYVAVLYSTVDMEYFYKTSGNIFPMPHVHCKNIDNGHTLLKCRVDKLKYSDANQGTVSHSTFYHLVIIETKIVYKICTLNVCCCLIKQPVKFPMKHHTTIRSDKRHTVPQITQ